jgi:hypothetical protein
MTQLLDTSPDSPYVCIWDDDMPCEVRPLIDHGVDEQTLLEFMFNNDFPPHPAPVPLPPAVLMLGVGLVALVAWKRLTA